MLVQRRAASEEALGIVGRSWGLGLSASLHLVDVADARPWSTAEALLLEGGSGISSKLLARWWPAVDTVDLAVLVHNSPDAHQRTRLRALQNSIGGRWLSDDWIPEELESRAWAVAARIRLGLPP